MASLCRPVTGRRRSCRLGLFPQADLATLTEKVGRRVVRWFRIRRFLDADAAADMVARENSGFSVDASVRITLIDRDVPSYFQSLEHLLRYGARPRRPGDFSGDARRVARHRHPQSLTAFHATVRTAREKSDFKAGLRPREKPGLEHGYEAPRHLEASVASSFASPGCCILVIRPARLTLAEVPLADLTLCGRRGRRQSVGHPPG
jgi:hypothetical protein